MAFRSPYTRNEQRADETGLTPREREITQLVCQGLSNKEIGRKLKCSDGTIKVHLHNIYQKLTVSNRMKLLAWRAVGDQSDE